MIKATITNSIVSSIWEKQKHIKHKLTEY